MRLPTLAQGRIYLYEEIEQYVVVHADTRSDDFLRSRLHFPRRLDNWDQRFCPPDSNIAVVYGEEPTETFRSQVEANIRKWGDEREHTGRVRRIEQLIAGGACALPVFTQWDDVQCRVFEGQHRMVAFTNLYAPAVPTFRMRFVPFPKPEETRERLIAQGWVFEESSAADQWRVSGSRGTQQFDRQQPTRDAVWRLAFQAAESVRVEQSLARRLADNG